jgi:hypothetical protein
MGTGLSRFNLQFAMPSRQRFAVIPSEARNLSLI